MSGYNPNFLSTKIELPKFALRLEGKVLSKPELRDTVYRDYIHYTLAMHEHRRSPIFAALNIDQSSFISVDRGGWDIDDLIGAENQMDNAYYYKNRWDRGHIARRASAAWGDSIRDARAASDSTMFFTNACLQFDSFNQDEWLAMEDWVRSLKADKDNKITVFSGPIYGDSSLFVSPENRKPAEIPAAFFKVVCFINKQDDLEVRAFILPQDLEAMSDWRGNNRYDYQTYQTTVAEIEELTGIVFPDIVAETNPLYYYENEEVRNRLGVASFPENIPVDRAEDLESNEAPRTVLADEEVNVFIIAALPSPKGPDKDNEWVSIINLESNDVSLKDWVLSDNSNRKGKLTNTLHPGESVRLQGPSLGKIRLGNNSEVATVRNETLHEGLFFNEPLGFNTYGHGETESLAGDQTILQMTKLTSRLILGILKIPVHEYLKTSITNRQRFGVEVDGPL